ncbi:alpha/beta hydrolase [Sciscionella marina]|uniref:alpha/beta hydrolase n=1 Tax=Sciscionella marina TaxID=508770 RepID=UPI000379E072|nr:alpha/beta fold hydrolase [Sciscionella marina]
MERFVLTSLDGIGLDAVAHLPTSGATQGVVVQFHGINANMDEGGMYVRLADQLVSAGSAALRISFRGHGGSGGAQRGATIAGEMLDLQAAIEYVMDRWPARPLYVVASSFGAVSTALSLPWLDSQLAGLVLWNPVLDLRRTFLEPELPWGLENYSPEQQARLHSRGSLFIDGEFELGRVMWSEFGHYNPADEFTRSRVASLVVHGDRDTAVSYEIAKTAAAEKSGCQFHTVTGSDHGFDTRAHEDEAIAATIAWLTEKSSAS